MKREIKFRGKSAQGHEWVYGHYYNNWDVGVNQDVIISPDLDNGTGKEYLINTQYLGQYTGLKDTGDVEIYEGDIVDCGYGRGIVIFKAGCFMVQWINDPESYMEFLFSRKGMHYRRDDEQFCIVGNIHDNPELINN